MKCIEILANDTKLLYPVIMPCFFTENLLVRVLNYNAVEIVHSKIDQNTLT